MCGGWVGESERSERREGQRTRENGVIMKSERHTERTLPHHTQSGSRVRGASPGVCRISRDVCS